MRILHDSTQSFYRAPFGALKQDETCVIRLKVPVACASRNVYLVLEKEDTESEIPMDKSASDTSYDTFSVQFSLPETGIYHYHFYLETEETDFSLFRYAFYDTNIEEGDKWQITCYPEDFGTPEFLAGSVMYQIFPDRFAKEGNPDLTGKLGPFTVHSSVAECPDYLPDANGKILNSDFFGGNFKGIESRVPYLESLGVKIIYLNPVSVAYSNHRYDTADYMKPDPMLGTERDFANLCEECHKHGIRVILDGVFSHTGSDSVYFDAQNRFGNGAVSAPETSPYRKWYRFDESEAGYESWWGISTLPCVNELDPDYLEYIITGENSVIAHWMGLGADGYRLDVADELPDEFIKVLRKRLKELNPDALLIGEVWEDASNKVSYGVSREYFTGGELDSVMNYPFREAILDLLLGGITPEEFDVKVMTVAENYPPCVLKLLMNSLSTHDTPRILTLLGGISYDDKADRANAKLTEEQYANACRLEKLAAVLQYTLPGIPCIYYGDETGMEGYEDPLNRRFFVQNNGREEITDFYRKLAELKKYPAFCSADISFDRHDTLIIMKRYAGDGTCITVTVNPYEKDVSYSLQGKVLMSENAGDGIVGAYGYAVTQGGGL